MHSLQPLKSITTHRRVQKGLAVPSSTEDHLCLLHLQATTTGKLTYHFSRHHHHRRRRLHGFKKGFQG